MRKIFTLVIIFSAVLFFGTQIVRAQTTGLLPTDVNLELNPEMPGANQSVTATVSSYGTDLDAASISWSVNGKTISSGKGLKSFSFTTGRSNTATTLSVNITTSIGEKISKTYTLKSSSVDLLWEAVGFVPPFYEGKTLFSHQDEIKFVAVPHIIGSNGAEIPAGNLIYTWTKNGSVVGNFSGYGKSSYTKLSSIISRPLEISVQVTAPNSDDMAEADIVTAPVDPTVVFYENDPLYGVQFQKALTGDVTMPSGREINILAQPFFFGLDSVAGGLLSYNWEINNSQIDNDTTKMSRVFRQKEGTSGTAYISLSVTNSDKILQYSSGGFNLNFSDISSAVQNTF